MSWHSFLVAALALGIPQTLAANETQQSEPARSSEMTPAVVKIIQFAKPFGMRMLVYTELDDARSGPAISGMNFIGRPPGQNALISFDDANMSDLWRDITAELTATGPRGTRVIVIVIDGDDVSVVRAPSPGSIEGFNGRLREMVDKTFPGHS